MNNFSLRIVHKKNLRQEDNKNIRTEFKYGISVFKCIILLLSNGNCGITCREIKLGCRESFSFLSILGRTLEKRNEIKPIRSNCGTVAFSSFEILAEFSNDFLPPQVSPKNVLTRGLK